MNFFPRILLAIAVLGGLAACGYKGPLYRPDARPEAVEPTNPSRVITLPAPQRQKEDREREGREADVDGGS